MNRSLAPSPPVRLIVQQQEGKIAFSLAPAQELELCWQSPLPAALTTHLVHWLQAYAEKRTLAIDFALAAVVQLSASHQRLLRALATVSLGTTISYRDLSARAGYHDAARFAGLCCARNPLPLLIPCHRVVPTTGGLGRFAYGQRLKQTLLRFEGAWE